MQHQKAKHLIIQKFGSHPIVQERDIPDLTEGSFLVKVDASTINPSDRLFMDGMYFQRPLPTTCGLEGTGRIVKVNGEDLQGLLNKRICFTNTGTWATHIVLNIKSASFFQLDEDVPLSSAASGIVNPLTVLGFYYTYKQHKKNGIIHTAAASALGRQLNRLCISKGVPLLNIVRRQEQVDLLKNEGAQYIINTSNANWLEQFKELVKTHNFNCLFDALGGGDISEKLFENMPPNSKCHVYGALTGSKLSISPTSLLSGLKVEGFLLFPWWNSVSKEIQQEIKKDYSKYLKNELLTSTFKEFKMQEISQAIECSVKDATSGKVLLKFY